MLTRISAAIAVQVSRKGAFPMNVFAQQTSGTVNRQNSRAEMALIGVYEISKVLASPNRLEVTLSGVLSLLSSFLDMGHGLIALLDGKGDPEMVVGSGWSEASAKRYFDLLPERAVGQIVATKMPLVVPNVLESPLFAGVDLQGWGPEGAVAFSLVGVPVKDGDTVVGTLTIDRPHDDATQPRFDEDVRFLTMVANLVGQTLRMHKAVTRDRERLMSEQARREKEHSAVASYASSDAVRPAAGDKDRPGVVGIVTNSPIMLAVIDRIKTVAKGRATVLLRGETGTGKELFANAIHSLSPRQKGPLVKLNCAALPETVLESELFGHEKGSFTGAHAQHKGRFEMADGGTLFLDEIGEISATFQAKLLRVLQEGEFERVGGTRPIKTDFRLICATNRNLEEMVAKGEFRADLYYRINVVPVFLPPLRDRKGDVPVLAKEFLRRFNKDHGTELTLTEGALGVMNDCVFPGNIREMENCLARTATLARGERIMDTDFACRSEGCLSSSLWRGASAQTPAPGYVPLPVVAAPSPAAQAPVAPIPVTPFPAAAPAVAVPSPGPAALGDGGGCDGAAGGVPHVCPAPGACPVPGADNRSERERLIEAMETAGWVQAKAARIMGLTPRQIGYALRKNDIDIKKF